MKDATLLILIFGTAATGIAALLLLGKQTASEGGINVGGFMNAVTINPAQQEIRPAPIVLQPTPIPHINNGDNALTNSYTPGGY